MTHRPTSPTLPAIQWMYDHVPYPDHPYDQSHPTHLATLATLFGMSPPPVDQCQVLEVGCAGGGNLIPLSETYPHSTFVGIDLSERQIAVGKATIAALGLTNITLKQQDIQTFDAGQKQFDYIIAHGVYSWVPKTVQDSLLALCKRYLAPNGVAYISYNTYPGWHMFGMIREMLLFHTRHITDPYQQAAAAEHFLHTLSEHIPDTYGAYRDFLRTYSEFLQRKMDQAGDQRYAFLLHDELATINTPVTFHQFIEHTAQYGLQYLTESCLPNVLPENLSPSAAQHIHALADNLIDMEQYIDFFRGCSFRETLLCHQHVRLTRQLTPQSIYHLQIASPAHSSPSPEAVAVTNDYQQQQQQQQTGEVAYFQGEKGGGFALDHPLSKAAFHILLDHYPHSLDFASLVQQAQTYVVAMSPTTLPITPVPRDVHIFIANLFKLFLCSTDIIHLRSAPLPLGSANDTQPTVRPLVRWLVTQHQRDSVTNLLHKRVTVPADLSAFLPFVDGTRDHAQLQTALTALQEQSPLPYRPLDDLLKELEKLALLIR